MFDLTPYLTIIVATLGIIVGTLITPKIQHRVGTQYSRRDLIFKKKIEYFEKITETIEKNKRLYNNIFHKLEENNSRREAESALKELKNSRTKFMVMASPLYFNSNSFSEKIISFVSIEKKIFHDTSSLADSEKEKKEEILEQLREDLRKIKKKGEEIISEMKKGLLTKGL